MKALSWFVVSIFLNSVLVWAQRGQHVSARTQVTEAGEEKLPDNNVRIVKVDKHPHEKQPHEKQPHEKHPHDVIERHKDVEGGRDPQPRTARVIVTYKNDDGRQKAMEKAKTVYHDFGDENSLAIELDSLDADELLIDANIDLVEEDPLWYEQGFLEEYIDITNQDSNDNHLRRNLVETTPYGITMTQGDQVPVGPYRAAVCLVDTGVAIGHPDIDPSRTTGMDRYSKIDGGKLLKWNNDTRGHGTHVAGTVAARVGNNIGVRGMGNIPLIITRGLNDVGNAYESDVREAIAQCGTAGARIISLSLGGASVSTTMKNLLNELNNKGILIFAAAGNDGKWKLNYPAALPYVVSVTAVQANEAFWPMSNYGPFIDLAAPGHMVLSTTVRSGAYVYATYSGTSMATPHASAAAALLWSHFPSCTNNQIKYALAYTSKDVGPSGCDTDYGYGIVKTKAAYDFLSNNDCDGADWGQNTNQGFCKIIDVAP